MNRWLAALIRCYRPATAGLLQERDQAVARWGQAHPDGEVLEDKRLEITSSLAIDLECDVPALG